MKGKINIFTLLIIGMLLSSCGGTSTPQNSTEISQLEIKNGVVDIPASDKKRSIVLLNTSSQEISTKAEYVSKKPHTSDTDSLRNFAKKLIQNNVPFAKKSKINTKYTPLKYEVFHVLTNINDPKSCEDVPSILIYNGSHITIYLDYYDSISTPDKDALTQSLENLGLKFDNMLPVIEKWFGKTSDLDNNEHIIILFTSMVSKAGRTIGDRVSGYFFSGDLFNTSSYLNPCSNEGEIIYINTPPAKATGSLAGTMAHELQHLIRFNVRVIENGSDQEERWFDESLSHIAEDLVGYGKDNDLRAEKYLLSDHPVSLTNEDDSIEQRGMGYLLMRWILNNFGSSYLETIHILADPYRKPFTRISTVTGSSFEQTLTEFAKVITLSPDMIGPPVTDPAFELKTHREEPLPSLISSEIKEHSFSLPPYSISSYKIPIGRAVSISFVDPTYKPTGFMTKYK